MVVVELTMVVVEENGTVVVALDGDVVDDPVEPVVLVDEEPAVVVLDVLDEVGPVEVVLWTGVVEVEG